MFETTVWGVKKVGIAQIINTNVSVDDLGYKDVCVRIG